MKVVAIVLNDFKNDSRVLKENKTISGMGHEVEVIALHEPGLPETEMRDQTRVKRIALTSRNWGKWKPIQILKYIEFVFRAIRLAKGADVCHCHDLNALPIGVLTKKLSKKPVKIVYDAHEYETEKNGLSGWLKKGMVWLERRLIKHADKIITVSDSIANDYKKLYNIETPEVILNCPYYQEVEKKDLFRDEFELEQSQTLFLYQGALSPGRGIEQTISAFKQRKGNDAVVVFMGYGSLVGYIQAEADASKNIFYLPAVSPDVVLDYTVSADIGISFIQDTCLSYRYCLPNKLFEYMMAGLPVMVSNLPEMSKLVESNGVGSVLKDNKLSSFDEAIDSALDLLGNTEINEKLKLVSKKYNWQQQEEKLSNIYDSL